MYHWQISNPELQVHLQRGRQARADAFARVARRAVKGLGASVRSTSTGIAGIVRWVGRAAGVMHARRRDTPAHCAS